MKLDATDVRYLSPEEFRVLTAVEMGSKNHEVVPSPLIAQISALRHAGINKLLGNLLKRRLVARVSNAAYDGFRLTYGGYDYLAVRALSKRRSVYAVGSQIGVGKESDIYMVSTEEGECRVMKMHRLGRISFRKIKEKRDYMGKRKSASWMYMSRLAAEKEFMFMQILHEHGFPVPVPIDHARHTIVMSYEEAYPLRQIAVLPIEHVRHLYVSLMELIVRLARVGLIHGDFNEFNILVKEIHEEGDEDDEGEGNASAAAEPEEPEEEDLGIDGNVQVEQGKGFERVIATDAEDDEEESEEEDSDEEAAEGLDAPIELSDGVRVEPVLIDFPQMVSIEHPDAKYYFEGDVECIRRFFRKAFRFESDGYPTFEEAISSMSTVRLDALTRASGYGKASERDAELEEHLAGLRLRAQSEEEPEGGLEGDSAGEEEEEGSEGKELTEGAPAFTPAEMASRVAAERAKKARRSQKHHGRSAQATKVGRRPGAKAKHNKHHIVYEASTF